MISAKKVYRKGKQYLNFFLIFISSAKLYTPGWATGTQRAVKPATQTCILHTRNTLLKQASPDRRARRIGWCAQLRTPHGRRAQSGAPSSTTRTAVNDNQYMTLNCRLKPVRILRLCAPSNTVCTAARTGRPDIRRRGPRAYIWRSHADFDYCEMLSLIHI